MYVCIYYLNIKVRTIYNKKLYKLEFIKRKGRGRRGRIPTLGFPAKEGVVGET